MSHPYFTLTMILSFFFLGMQDSLRNADTLPKVKPVAVSEKKVVVVIKPVIDRPFFDSLNMVKGSIVQQRKVMDSMVADVVPKAEFDALIASQKAQFARLRRIFNMLPQDVQDQIILLDSLETLQPTIQEKKSPELPQVELIKSEPGLFERIRKLFIRKRHKK